ncbi:ABC transporter permease [Microbacterium halophytorum]|uniref:ABC transporter permease n=1 Tax=Microbacterium halophytorum TaxID=2067568 RepID=UPI000CFB0E05|nr:ABC transporter permease [Microbacterium halophytorum]
MIGNGYGVPRPAHPGMRAWGQLVLAETRSVVRDTAGLIIPIGMPTLLLLTQGAAPSEQILPGSGGRSVFELFVLPILLVMVVALVGVVNMPSFLAAYRKGGLLKRLAATPAHPAMLLVAQVVTSLAQTLVGVGIAVAAAAAVFGIVGPEQAVAAIGAFLLVCAAMYAVGMIVAAVAPTPNAAVAIGLVVFFGIGAAGGLFGGKEQLPEVVAVVGAWLPYGAGVEALQHAWVGEPLPWEPVVALAAAAAIGGAAAVRLFRWSR